MVPAVVAAQRPTDSLFFAVYPDPKTVARIAALTQRLREEHCLTALISIFIDGKRRTG